MNPVVLLLKIYYRIFFNSPFPCLRMRIQIWLINKSITTLKFNCRIESCLLLTSEMASGNILMVISFIQKGSLVEQ